MPRNLLATERMELMIRIQLTPPRSNLPSTSQLLTEPACHNKLICTPTTCLRLSSISRLSPTRIMLLNNREEVVIQCLPKAAFLSNIHTKHRAKSCIPVHGGSSLTLIPDT